MIEYIIANNPDHRILQRISKELKDGKLVCIPTDTNWVVVCDPFSPKGVEKLYRIRKANPEKHFSLLCDTISRANELAVISDRAFKLIRHRIPGCYTFIFEARKKTKKALKASKKDSEIGIRFPGNALVSELIKTHGEVLLSANVTHEMLALDDMSIEIYAYLIEDNLGYQISVVLDPGELEFLGASTIVSFIDDEVDVLREGAGDSQPFI